MRPFLFPARALGAAALLGAVSLSLVGCGGKTNEHARAAGITPSNALAFVTVSLDPSIEQKKNLLGIARAFPGVKAKDEFASARDDLLRKLLKGSGLDYVTDVKPWLGSEIAVAALPGASADDAPVAAVFLAANDKAKAEAAVAKADTRAGVASRTQHRFVDGYEVVVSDAGARGKVALDTIARQAQAKSGDLASSAGFTAPVGELHGDRLLLAWVDSKRAIEAASRSKGAGLPSQFGADFAKQYENASPVAVDFHAGDKAFVLEGVTRSTIQAAGGEPRLAESLPATTLAALSVFDLGGTLDKALGQVGAGGGDPAKAFADTTGLDLRRDVLAWMKGEVTVAVGPTPHGEDIPDFALVVQPTDRAAAEAALPRIRATLAEHAGAGAFRQQTIAGVTADVLDQPVQGTLQPAMGLFADRFVIASRPAYLAEIAKAAPTTLAGTDAYRSVITTGTSGKTLAQLVVRVDAVREAVEHAWGLTDDPDYVAKTRPNLEPLDVLGARAYKAGAFDRFELKLTVS